MAAHAAGDFCRSPRRNDLRAPAAGPSDHVAPSHACRGAKKKKEKKSNDLISSVQTRALNQGRVRHSTQKIEF